ncbi:MAG: helix-turn-helix domain-containing protein [Acetobacter sp.]|nr:helix-turn-helix domain-containing protein [Bacteroides sp.]MCM1341677.1 helix-turn-helix domain-containing protein [Acetobacter sp.]MCM1434274.1 helix-turn-helix domain-containing protein [Clostridiales bacterium]
MITINRIEEIRKRKKLSQTDICKSLKISKKTYYNYVHKDIIPSDVLVKLSNMFECSTDYLLGLSNYTAIIVTDANSNVLAVIEKEKVIEHSDCRIIFSEY